MKRSMNPRSIWKFTAMALVMAVGFTACNDDDDLQPLDREAEIGVLNLLTDVDAVNVHLDDEKINTSAIQAGVFSTYYTVDAGQNALTVFEAGETDTLASLSHDFKVNESFSAFILGDRDDATLVIASDNLSAPAAGKAKIRFANFAADNDGLELWAGAGETALIDAVDYKSVESYVDVDPAEDVVLRVRGEGSDLVLAELDDVTIQAGKIYTAYVVAEEVEGVETLVLRVFANK